MDAKLVMPRGLKVIKYSAFKKEFCSTKIFFVRTFANIETYVRKSSTNDERKLSLVFFLSAKTGQQ